MPRPLDSQPCDPAAGASSHALPRRRGAVAVIERAGALLVIRRSQIVVAPGAYCFPGGGIEPGESEVEALVRELLEELQVEVRPLRRLWSSVTPWNVELAWWHAGMSADAIPQPAPAEVESVHWYTLAEMAELPNLLESNRQFLAAIERREIVLGA